MVAYFAVFILPHNENTHLYSFGIEWVRDIKGTGGQIGSGSCDQDDVGSLTQTWRFFKTS